MNRRDFFRRTAPLAAAALVAPPLLAMRRDSEVAKVEDMGGGRVLIDGTSVQIHGGSYAAIEIRATRDVAIHNCRVNSGENVGILVARDNIDA